MTAWELIQEINNYSPNPTSDVVVHFTTKDEYPEEIAVTEGKKLDGYIKSVGASRYGDCLHIEVEEQE